MANLLSNLELGLSALRAQRMNIQFAGSNIANVETDGYSRRRVDLRADLFQNNDISLGVSVEGIQRLQSPFISKLLSQELGNLGQFEAYSNGLENLESIFYVSGDASNSTLSNAMEQFWGSFDELANNPESLETRNVVRERAKFLVTTFNDFFERLTSFQKKVREDIKMKVEEINRIAKEIAQLNAKIGMAKGLDDEASGLEDKRESLVNQLAGLVDTKTFETQNGMLSINVGHKPLVHSDSYKELEVHFMSDDQNSKAASETIIQLKDSRHMGHEETLRIEDGELRGLIDMSDSVIPEYIQDLDKLAYSLIKEVNAVHREGTGLDGSTENNLFAPPISDETSISGMSGRIEVSEDIIEDSRLIAASKTGAIGDAQIAMAVVQLREKFTMESETVTFDEYYQGVVSKIGTQTQKALEDLDVQGLLVEQLERRKKSITGVSLDEEASNLVRFQKAYQAAAKYMNIIDEMLDTILKIA